MPHHANAHLVLNSRDRTLPGCSGVYNNFNLTNEGQNVVQGQMKDIALSEVLFPYDIPNMQAGYNIFQLTDVNAILPKQTIVIPPGFYTGAQLAAAVSDPANAYDDYPGTPSTVPAGDLPVCSYDSVTNRFTFVEGGGANPWQISSPYTFATGYTGLPAPGVGKDILSIMGFQGNEVPLINNTNPASGLIGGSAPLVFTQYIDICSPKLCQYQFIRDGSTTTLARRVDLICRLYIEDETSTTNIDLSGDPVVSGTRPFVIHRQFTNQRVMRWTAANSVGGVDIQLYDDIGQPLATTWQPRNFQLSFHVYEGGDNQSGSNVGYY
jgi:hypothetical protein